MAEVSGTTIKSAFLKHEGVNASHLQCSAVNVKHEITAFQQING